MKLTIAALLAVVGMASEGGPAYRRPAHHSRAGYQARSAPYRHSYGNAGRGEKRTVGPFTRQLPTPGVRGRAGYNLYRQDPARGHYDNDRRRDNYIADNKHRQAYLANLRANGKAGRSGSMRSVGGGYGAGQAVYAHRRPQSIRSQRQLSYDSRR